MIFIFHNVHTTFSAYFGLAIFIYLPSSISNDEMNIWVYYTTTTTTTTTFINSNHYRAM